MRPIARILTLVLLRLAALACVRAPILTHRKNFADKRSKNVDDLRTTIATIMLMAVACAGSMQAQDAHGLPVVISGEMPVYPALARRGGIKGEVQLRVTTDGSAVASVEIVSGHPLLAWAAENYVRSWKFVEHKSTVFSTRFAFRLIEESTCEPDPPQNSEVVLRLPTEVEISALHRVKTGYCNPNAGLDLSEPLRVFVTSCDVDGSSVPCRKMHIRLQSGALTVTPRWFEEAKTKQGFVVPKEFRSLKTFDLHVNTPRGDFTISDLEIPLLKGYWRLGIDHAQFKESTGMYGMASSVRCVGFVEFQWFEPTPIYLHVCK